MPPIAGATPARIANSAPPCTRLVAALRWMDLFVAHEGYNMLYRNDAGTFTRVTSSELSSNSVKSCGAAWADVNNDGLLDVYVTNKEAVNELYLNRGGDTFEKIVSMGEK